VLAVVLLLGVFPSEVRAEASEQQVIVDEAVLSLRNFKGDPNMEWFRENLHKAKGLVIFPKLYKGGFILGGSGGRGSCWFRIRHPRTGLDLPSTPSGR